MTKQEIIEQLKKSIPLIQIGKRALPISLIESVIKELENEESKN